MSHRDDPLDEGMLHAFLDGALPAELAAQIETRVRESPDARAQLDLARRLRTEADELVELVQFEPGRRATPLHVPLVAAASAAPATLAAAPVAGRAGNRVPWYRRQLDRSALGWAAGLLLLVGTVWLGTPDGSNELPGAPSSTPLAASEKSEPAPAPRAPEPTPAPAPTSMPKARTRPLVTGEVDLARREDKKAIVPAASNTLQAPVTEKPSVEDRTAARALRERAAPVMLDEMVATGASAAVTARAAGQSPIATARVLRIAGLAGGTLEQLSDGGVRTVYAQEGTDQPIVLEQWQIATPHAGLDEPASAPPDEAVRGRAPSIRWVQNGVRLQLSGPVAIDSLERLRRRVE